MGGNRANTPRITGRKYLQLEVLDALVAYRPEYEWSVTPNQDWQDGGESDPSEIKVECAAILGGNETRKVEKFYTAQLAKSQSGLRWICDEMVLLLVDWN